MVQIYAEEAAHARLDAMGLDWEVLEDAFKYGLAEAGTCTKHDAGFCKGVLLYSRLGRRLQESLELVGWEGGRPSNQQSVWSFRHGVRILHVTGNSETANREKGAAAAPERPGGSARQDLIKRNAEHTLLDELPESAGYKELRTWFLLYRTGLNALRSELSFTENPTDDGGGIAWSERIILPEVALPEGVELGDDQWEYRMPGAESE
ncbi:hypothetical protein [Glycomyces salinus]|uniref:hypothetical protein n=1 Tax=Glycomyces salinus TaxID=980294 RepID=UPI0018EE10D0|nr:hypothetical protein [Glycomyces salinus]